MRIQSPNGIDLRSAGMLVGEANKFQSYIMMYHGEYKMNCKSLMSMLACPVGPEADVVITNPTHFAVALKYDSTIADAPIVTAKGQDFLAKRIKDLARENGVEIVENKPLARMLCLQISTKSAKLRVPCQKGRKDALLRKVVG